MARVEAKRLVTAGAVLLVLGLLVALLVSSILGGLVIVLSIVAFGAVAVQSAKATRAREKGDGDRPDFPEEQPSGGDEDSAEE